MHFLTKFKGFKLQLFRQSTLFSLAFACFISLVSSNSFAEDAIYTRLFSSTAVSGYDAVAYFTQGKPVKGDSSYSLEYMGANWNFKNAENLAKFKANPATYAPQFGGYCAWAVAHNTTAKGDPTQWTIFEGKLYLNYDADIQSKWTSDKANQILLANKNWPGVL